MKRAASIQRVGTVITTHQNADFDSLAAAVAAAKLYPDARIVFPGAMNRNVREFVALYGETLPILPLRAVDLSSIKRIVVVDTADFSRIGDFAPVCESPGVEVVVFDHHPGEAVERPPFVRPENWVVSADGSQAASMVQILRGRDIPISALEASIFALGIHEDTGSLTYPQSTVRDAEMLAVCMRLGASQALIERYLHNPLTPEQRDLLLRVIDEVRTVRVGGHDVFVVALDSHQYVDGLSIIAHKVMELLNCEVLVQAVSMIGRVFVTARSRLGAVDVARLLREIGGGGHAQAASAVVRDATAQEVIDRLIRALGESVLTVPTAAEIMSKPVHFISADTPVTEALLAAQRYGHSGIAVQENGEVVGIAARRDLDKALRHGLGHAPVKGIMTRGLVFAPESATVDELRRLMVDANVGRIPIVADDAYPEARRNGKVRIEHVKGIVTRTDVLAAFQESRQPQQALAPYRSSVVQTLDDLPFFGPIIKTAAALATDFDGVYLVGGFVRDLLLGVPNADLDLAVEGDGIEFATLLAREIGGRVRPHHKFRTAVVVPPERMLEGAPLWIRQSREPFHIDVVTCRTEFYDYPAALPVVEHASIRQDLFRRDFTINAMAVSLKGDEYGTVIDFFGGLRDLKSGVIRVLHNLSFIEDPTRIFRAVRYENRYGFRMDEQTRALAKGCVDIHLVGDLSSARLRDELIALLGERDVDWSLERLYELGIARQVHPKLATGPRTLALIHRIDALAQELNLLDEIVRWRIRLAAMTRNMEHDELFIWLDKLRLKRKDADVVRASVVLGPRIGERLEAEPKSAWMTYLLLSHLSTESVLYLLAVTESRIVQDRIYEYLTELRHRVCTLSGADILAMGVKEGPLVGEILRAVLRERVEGRIVTREEEITLAQELVRRHQGGEAA